MQRYFMNYSHLKLNQSVTFTKEQNHHIQKVLRMKTGDQVIGVDQNKKSFLLELKIIDTINALVIKELNYTNELPISIDFACGLPKGKKLEHIVQKGSELGVHNIYPWAAERSVVKWNKQSAPRKIKRLQKIATEACEQSHRNYEVQIKDIADITDLTMFSDRYDYVLVAYEEAAKSGETSQLAKCYQSFSLNKRVLMIFGPEGGISPDEIEQFKKIKNIHFVGLGKRILRTETAPLFALSALAYELELR